MKPIARRTRNRAVIKAATKKWQVVTCGLVLLPALIITGQAKGQDDASMKAVRNAKTGTVVLSEGDRAVLCYNYGRIDPAQGFVERVHANSRKYARPRSNYIHPLYGPDGEVLTEDWSVNHPHHRGIYWAWPEVDFHGERGDLHALQRVFARPTGKIKLKNGTDFTRIEAENVWQWNDKTPIVREVTTIVAHRAKEDGRLIDLEFQFSAIEEGVSIARRATNLYGGLNIRLSPVSNHQVVFHTDDAGTSVRRAWADSVGTRAGGKQPVGFALFQNTSNPQYPGDWVEYPALPWFQPTFPAAGSRYELKKGKPLVLRYRLWIRRGGAASAAEYDAKWQAYNRK